MRLDNTSPEVLEFFGFSKNYNEPIDLCRECYEAYFQDSYSELFLNDNPPYEEGFYVCIYCQKKLEAKDE